MCTEMKGIGKNICLTKLIQLMKGFYENDTIPLFPWLININNIIVLWAEHKGNYI